MLWLRNSKFLSTLRVAHVVVLDIYITLQAYLTCLAVVLNSYCALSSLLLRLLLVLHQNWYGSSFCGFRVNINIARQIINKFDSSHVFTKVVLRVLLINRACSIIDGQRASALIERIQVSCIRLHVLVQLRIRAMCLPFISFKRILFRIACKCTFHFSWTWILNIFFK